MSLHNIQSLMLNLSISPALSKQLFAEPERVRIAFQLSEEELRAAQRLQARDVETFQNHVAVKRLNRVGLPYLKRSFSLFPDRSHVRLMREYVATHEMRQNVWLQHIGTFLDFLAERVAGEAHPEVMREVFAFEKWVYESCLPTEDLVGGSDDYRLAPNVRVATFLLPGDLLIEGQLRGEALVELYGTSGYVLSQWNGEEVDLYEIDSGYYEFLTQCAGRAFTKQALLELAAGIAARYEDRSVEQMLDELCGAGILIASGEEVEAWQEA